MSEKTLTTLLQELKSARKQIFEGITIHESAINELNDVLKKLDILVHDNKTSEEKYELLQYKSSLLQLKSEFLSQLEISKKSLNSTDQTIVLFEKTIQLNTGDVF